MRRFFFLVLFTLPLFCFGQNVVKERIVGFSRYEFDVRYDSSVIHYKDKQSSNDIIYPYLQFPSEYRQVGFNRVDRYDNSDKIIGIREFRKGNNTVEAVWVHPVSGKISNREYIEYYKNTDDYTYRISQWDVDGDKDDYFEQWRAYDNSDRVIKDNYYYNYPNNEWSSVNWEHVYFNENLKKSTQTVQSSNSPQATTITIDSNGVNYEHKERIELDSNLNEISRIRNIKIQDLTGNQNIHLSLENINGKWDTIGFQATMNIKIVKGNVHEDISLVKYFPTDTFKNASKIIREFDDSGNNILYETYYTDTLFNWKLLRATTSEYDQNNRMVRSQTLDYYSKDTTVYTFTYNEKGSLTRQVSSHIRPNSSIKTTYNYYYETYLTEETDLIYTQLSPIVYPNPASDYTNILFSVVPNKKGILTIFNHTGNIVHQHNFSSPTEIYQYTWNTGSQPVGIYLARITMGKEVAQVKIIKQ